MQAGLDVKYCLYRVFLVLIYEQTICIHYKIPYHPVNDNLRHTLQQLTEMSSEEWNTLSSILVHRSYKKGDMVLAAGQICRGIYFVSSGVLRTYLLSDGKEVNAAFTFKHEFVHELESLSTGEPSLRYIQALSDAEIIFINKEQLVALYDHAPVFQEMGRKILEQIAITEQKYASLFTIYSPEERYRHIIKNHPELIRQIPLKHLASYLGIARETLSRIRGRIS